MNQSLPEKRHHETNIATTLQAVLKGNDLNSLELMHKSLAQQLNFPAYYGNNLSALADMLSSISKPTQIVFEFDEEGTDEEFHQKFVYVCARESLGNPNLSLVIAHH